MVQSNGTRVPPRVPLPTSRGEERLTSASDFLPLCAFSRPPASLPPPPPSAAFPPFRSHLEVKVAEGVSVTEEKFRKGLRERDRKRRERERERSRRRDTWRCASTDATSHVTNVSEQPALYAFVRERISAGSREVVVVDVVLLRKSVDIESGGPRIPARRGLRGVEVRRSHSTSTAIGDSYLYTLC